MHTLVFYYLFTFSVCLSFKHFTSHELLTQNFKKYVSNDTDMDPCKADFTTKTENVLKQRFTRASISIKNRIWEEAVIPYEIDDNYKGYYKILFKQAMRHWENYTCVKFVERNPEEHPNYIYFTKKSCGCCSFVGKRGEGRQDVSIGSKCDKFGIVVHELGHVLGFWHEHNRPDRDNFVKIIFENIIRGQYSNFKIRKSDEVDSLGSPYDFGSIMHYGKNTFAENRFNDTIQVKKIPGKQEPDIGQRIGASAGDIHQANLLYNCPKCGRTFQQTSRGTFSPSKYSLTAENEIICEWRITATLGERIVLNITDLDIETSSQCETSYLKIIDGYWNKSKILGQYCGEGKTIQLVSNGNRILVNYVNKNVKGFKGFSAEFEVVCGGKLEVTNKEHIESPNFPEDYSPNKECIWQISVPENYQVTLTFQSFELENHLSCLYDHLEIRDGFTEDSNLLKILCGYSIPEDIISTSNSLFVKFVSDGLTQKSGFSATVIKHIDECNKTDHGCEHFCINTLGSYRCSCKVGFELHTNGKNCTDACGDLFEEPNGTIISPSFPDLYSVKKYCAWEIVAPEMYRIVLNFIHFDLEANNFKYDQYCEYDAVIVSNIYPNGTLKDSRQYCGSISPGILVSDHNTLRLEFVTDDSIQKTGFVATYSRDVNECFSNNGDCEHQCVDTVGSYHCKCNFGYNLTPNQKNCIPGNCTYEITNSYGKIHSPNYPKEYPPNSSCVWHFITKPGHRIRITFFRFDVESIEDQNTCNYDIVKVYDGASTNSISLGNFSGTTLPPRVYSKGNHLYMTFRSDSNGQRTGFMAYYASICGGVLRATYQPKLLYSHAEYGVKNYDNVVKCNWLIKVADGYKVSITFLEFDLEFEEQCAYDYVEFINSDHTSYGKFCGNSKPQNFVSDSHKLTVKFKSNKKNHGAGFIIQYQSN